ncbi:MAG: signal peptide peptidase SppA [Pantoea sp. Brub]|nr:signal peptide peptidase SppA [Pantoea sp. Brub]
MNFIRRFFINFLIVFLIVAGVKIWFNIKAHRNNSPIQKQALKIDIQGSISDNVYINDFSKNNDKLLIEHDLFNHNINNSLFSIVEIIRQAKIDNNISGIVLDLNNLTNIDQPSMEYIGKTLIEFRNSGKPIYAIGYNYNQLQYFIASFSNKIFLDSTGSVDIKGFAFKQMYWKSLLDKLKITVNIFKAGIYKSAVEPLVLNTESPIVRHINQHIIDQSWTDYLKIISNNRNINPEQTFPNISDALTELKRFHGKESKYALQRRLVDITGSKQQIENKLISIFGMDPSTNSYANISVYDYAKQLSKSNNNNNIHNIAVIIINNIITTDKISLNRILNDIRNSYLNPYIKAVVLYINSPGGSVLATELIHRELANLHAKNKPIVVYMGNQAASGGYWVATAGDYIIANKNTITGSIGVFGIISTFEKSLNYLGIHEDGVASSPLANFSIKSKIPSEIKNMVQIKIKNNYFNFVNLVAKSRKRSFRYINLIGQGHIWNGLEAKKNGLIDSLGDFDDAIKKACELAKIKTPHILWYKSNINLLNVLLSNVKVDFNLVFLNTLQTFLPSTLLEFIFGMKDQTNLFNDPKDQYALCSSCVNVK